jgi:hypothetical protein
MDHKKMENEEDDQHSQGSQGSQGGGEPGAFSWAKKLMTVGVGAYFLTEDALKTLVSEVKLPKEIVSGILESAKGVRKEFMHNFVSEMMNRVSDKIDPATVISEVLKNNEITLEVKIKVKEKNSNQA